MKVKKFLKIVLCVVLALVLVAGGYLAYVFLDYYRLPDHLELEVSYNAETDRARGMPLVTNEPYSVVSWNIGFGAYEDDYGFFMDGGTQSWAWSKERLLANLDSICEWLAEGSDFKLVQEIDTDATRSYHVDEWAILSDALTNNHGWPMPYSVFAQNYDSPFLFYPLAQPHGASKAGVGTFSAYEITSALRRSLPIETGFTKFLDLDRCYSVSRIPVNGGGELVLYNLHLSAYTSDGTIATKQLRMLLEDMQGEYEAGNWCVAGGDFNKDLLGNSADYFGASDKEYTWAQPIPPETFDGVDIRLVAPLDEENPVPSCRNADGPYHAGQYVLTVDGFLVSPNVAVAESRVIDTGFRYSDHNPVKMVFTLTNL